MTAKPAPHHRDGAATGGRPVASWTAPEIFGWSSRPPAGGSRGADLLELAEVAFEAAQAGAAVLAAHGTGGATPVSGVATKISPTDMVSDVDRESEAAVSAVLSTRRPDDGILGEEGTARRGSTGVEWVVDPLDGTTNFLYGIPQYSVSIAAEVAGAPVAGVVIDPSRREIWAASRGSGAFLNGAPCRVREQPAGLDTALVATGFGYRAERRRWQAEVAARVIPAVRDIRRLGSAALDLCWTGAGRYDAYYEWGLNPWDFSAGALFASEAGATVRVLGDRLIVAAPAPLFDSLSDLLRSAGGFDAPPGPEPALWGSS